MHHFWIVIALCCAQPAWANGINLAWNECLPDGGTVNRTSTCTNEPVLHELVGSFVMDYDKPRFVGVEVYLYVTTSAQWLPDWWQYFNAGSCHLQGAAINGDFGDWGSPSCESSLTSDAAGGIAAYNTISSIPPIPSGEPTQGRFVMGFAHAQPRLLEANREYVGLRMFIRQANPNNCAGCDVPTCITLNSIHAVQEDGTRETMRAPLVRRSVSWHCALTGDVPQDPWPWACVADPGCATPAHGTSWGQIKSLYR